MKIYAIGHPEDFVKIGKSVKPNERLSELQTSSPYDLWLITTIEAKEDGADVLGSVERGLHTYYQAGNVKGEWFRIPPNEIDALGNVKSIRTSVLEDVIYEQAARAYYENSVDPHSTAGDYGKTLRDYLGIARNRRVIP